MLNLSKLNLKHEKCPVSKTSRVNEFMHSLLSRSDFCVCSVHSRAVCAAEVVFVVCNLPVPPAAVLKPSFTPSLSIPHHGANLCEMCYNGVEELQLYCYDC